jgi:hypothetical protein
MKKVVKPETPAAVEMAAPKVAAKRAAKVAMPFRKSYPVAKTSTANLSGHLSALQHARNVLHSARGIGEALDTLNRLEATARAQLSEAVTAELKTRRVKTTGLNVGTESKPDGVHIVLSKPNQQ